MILRVRVNNFLVYAQQTELSLVADMRIKKFDANVGKINNFSVVKAACIYGGNNVGKSCLTKAIGSIKDVLLGYVANVSPNIYTNSNLCRLGVTFDYNEEIFSYDFAYDSTFVDHRKKGFVYERLAKIEKDIYGNESEQELFVRDMLENTYFFANNADLSNLLKMVSSDNILIYTINGEQFNEVKIYKEILRNFALQIDFLDANNIPIEKTIKSLKENSATKNKVVQLIKLADLDIDDYTYSNSKTMRKPQINIEGNVPSDLQEQVLQHTVAIEDMFRLTSIHKGKPVQSLFFDSTGTKKMVSLASYIVEALEQGRILVVDELDSSLHFKLTRAIITLFNNDLNKKAQLIFTAHDGTLLDCKRLFRKDQIWFAVKNDMGAYLCPLKNFTAQEDGVRSESDILEMYKQGIIGSLPEPDLFSILLDDDLEDHALEEEDYE